MREYKFRAWINELQKFADSCSVCSDGSWDYSFGNITSLPEEDDELTQFTGLNDNNGKDLYENDLVINGRDMVVYQVVWVEENAKFILELVTKNPNACIELEMCPLTLSLFQCIGSIYEKPEWLEIENG